VAFEDNDVKTIKDIPILPATKSLAQEF